ncbi:hypothetical protein HDU98_011886 [Podochytrium sp. JEL0797]|nr:hypothetical protein HDU98_011886 [Podochytrium sp. JEL0797]
MSFFGFDAKLPPKGRQTKPGTDDIGEGSRLDELLEEKFKYGLELGEEGDEALLDEDEELNDETFGGADESIGNDFDFAAGAKAAFPVVDQFFAAQPQQNTKAISPLSATRGGSNPVVDAWSGVSNAPAKAPAASGPKMMSLEEIEAQMMSGHSQQRPLAPQHQPQQHQQQQQFIHPQQQQQHHPGFMPPNLQQQFSNQFGGSTEKRIMSVTELEESMLRDQQQRQQLPPGPGGGFPPGMMGPLPPHLQQQQQQQQFQGPPGQFPNFMGRPNMPPQMHPQFHQQMGMPPHMMGPPPPGSPGHMHRPGFNGMGPPPPGMMQQGPPMGGPMLQNQMFHQGGPMMPQFGNFPMNNNDNGPPRGPPGGMPNQQQQSGVSPRGTTPVPTSGNSPRGGVSPGQAGGSPVNPGSPAVGNSNKPLSDLSNDENLRQAQELAQHQHQMQMQHPQQQQQQQRGGGRGDYGQMRYNNAQAQNNRKNVLLHTGFSNEENYQRGASGKGPGPFDGGWSHQSNRTPRWVRYSESMTQYEKEMIARIQIAQLVSENPYRDDFYYQICTQFRSGDGSVATAGANWQQSMLNQGSDSSNEMQAQMKKLIEGKKLKPKGTTLAMEGALGKISLTSVKNPRKMIQINQAAKEVHAVPTFSRLTRRKILKSVEKVYTCVLNLEQLKRTVPEPGTEEEEEWKQEMQKNISEMWEELCLTENIPFTLPHPFPYFLSYAKGKRVLPRLVPYLTPDQMFSALTTLFSRAESLDVCNMPAGSQDEAIDLFISTVIPPLVSFISEVPLQVVNAFMRILLERHNMVWLAKSKAGLAFLALLLSRAEILKQGGGAQQGLRPPAADDLSLWTELYNFLFVSLQGNFAAIFPPVTETTSTKIQDEVYIWQFLAAMAVGATSADHQRVLLTEVRDKIFETSRRGSSSTDPDDARALANVNLFLNALGLGIDATQLASM